jgi:GNAT superfamily N-acetyltransferase
MIEIDKSRGEILAPLFAGMEDTLIWSYTQGVMGRGWADDAENPSCAKILVGDFCFLAGDCRAEGAAALAGHLPQDEEIPWGGVLIIPQSEGWGGLVEAAFPGRAEKIRRYAIHKEPGRFDRAKLQAFIDALPEGYELARIDAARYEKTLGHDFSGDFCSQFDSAEDYEARGLGFCVLHGGELVGGASSYTIYSGGIEIEIAVRKEHRRKGLATACAARLILECLDRGLYPSWDAANQESVALAEKLGYRFSHEYVTYSVEFADGEEDAPCEA